MNRKVFILKILIDNLIVSIAMSITASLLAKVFDLYTLITIPFSFLISTLISFIIPLGKISNWFSSLFKIEANSFKSQLIGDLLTNLIMTSILSLSCKLLIFNFNLKEALIVFINTYLVMYLVSYIVYESSNFITTYLFVNK